MSATVSVALSPSPFHALTLPLSPSRRLALAGAWEGGRSGERHGSRAVLRILTFIVLACGAALRAAPVPPVPPSVSTLSRTGSVVTLRFTPFPAAQQFRLLSSTNIGSPFTADPAGTLSGYDFTATNPSPVRFYQVEVTPMSSNALLGSIALNRLAYGPTPDEIERVLTGAAPIGAQAFINEQLAPETIAETGVNSHTNIAFLGAKMAGPSDVVTSTNANIADLGAWHVLRAVTARRQFLEVLLQWAENHFVTQHSKSSTYVNGVGAVVQEQIATQFEFLENDRWRAVLLNPTGTFLDLLRVSAESPAMIIYLDTVTSRGDGGRIANENYARELLELFTFGVDNGYDQTDITTLSRCWTGWYVEKVAVADAFNVFATALPGLKSTNVGVWAFNFRTSYHNTNSKSIFVGKTVPARFGAPWAGRNYQLNIPVRTGTNGIQDGYDVLNHLANQPFTMEYISVKLCRLLVHDDFAHGYDFTDPGLSAEGRLVKQCMLAWEDGTPKGQMRAVLSTIVNSDLFRSHGSAGHKVKTPMEFTVSTIRALRTSTNGTANPGTFSADTDGFAISGGLGSFNRSLAPLTRMGNMVLFDRDSPDGYPEDSPGWISAGTLAERLRFVQSVLIATGQSGKSDAGNNNVTSPLGLLQAKLPLQVPPGSVSNATNVVDYFLGTLYAGEGRANLDLYRTAALNFLNTDDAGASSPFSALTVSGTAGSTYDNRLRGMVAMLLTMQRFQEQ